MLLLLLFYILNENEKKKKAVNFQFGNKSFVTSGLKASSHIKSLRHTVSPALRQYDFYSLFHFDCLLNRLLSLVYLVFDGAVAATAAADVFFFM